MLLKNCSVFSSAVLILGLDLEIVGTPTLFLIAELRLIEKRSK
ncbi:hypothetical protein LEP1GSC197_1110 [Leptospira interrogans serovar Pomona str. CSL4002]|nr:hypothetical protein LEP1GSC197_1110 [Leptospira interrogans serovar Pomona str. CSL4002]